MKNVMIIESRVPEGITKSLANYARQLLPGISWESMRPWETFKTEMMINPYHCDNTTFSINATGVVTPPENIPHRVNGNIVSLNNKELITAITLALESVLRDIERILNKDLKGADHNIQVAIPLYKLTETPGEGFWHSDGNDIPVTSLIYFLHEGCKALLEFGDHKKESLGTIETQTGSCITFANQSMKHRVKDIKSDKGIVNRGLLTFWYRGPAALPPEISNPIDYKNSTLAKIKEEREGRHATLYALCTIEEKQDLAANSANTSCVSYGY